MARAFDHNNPHRIPANRLASRLLLVSDAQARAAAVSMRRAQPAKDLQLLLEQIQLNLPLTAAASNHCSRVADPYSFLPPQPRLW